MPRYFFHLVDGSIQLDKDGVELPDLHAARTEAVISLGQTIGDDPNFVWGHRQFAIEVSDEAGSVVARVAISVT